MNIYNEPILLNTDFNTKISTFFLTLNQIYKERLKFKWMNKLHWYLFVILENMPLLRERNCKKLLRTLPGHDYRNRTCNHFIIFYTKKSQIKSSWHQRPRRMCFLTLQSLWRSSKFIQITMIMKWKSQNVSHYDISNSSCSGSTGINEKSFR